MIFPAWGFFRSLHGYHHVMIIITILVPLLWSVVISLWLPNRFVLQVTLHLAGFLVFWLLAVLAVGLVLKRDRFKAEQFVSQEVGAVSGQIRILRQEHEDLILRHGDSIEDLKRQIDDQDANFRSAFEQMGIVPLPRRSPLRGGRSFGPMEPDVVVPKTVGSKWARLHQRLRRLGRWLKGKLLGKLDRH